MNDTSAVGLSMAYSNEGDAHWCDGDENKIDNQAYLVSVAIIKDRQAPLRHTVDSIPEASD